MRFLLLLFLAFGAAYQATAQPADLLCTYDACALRYEPQFFGRDLVRGAEGIPVNAGLSEAVAMSPRAREFAREYERTRTPALLTTLGSLVLVSVAGITREADLFDFDDGAYFALTAGGVGLGIFGIHLTLRSERARSRAVWWYNQSLPR
jgi:hypothetical protein